MLRKMYANSGREEKRKSIMAKFERASVATKFKSLRLVERGIKLIDPGLSTFCNLEVLDLSGNEIATIENVPESVRQLVVYDSGVTSLGSSSSASGRRDYAGESELVSLGAGYNLLWDEQIRSIHLQWPNLVRSGYCIRGWWRGGDAQNRRIEQSRANERQRQSSLRSYLRSSPHTERSTFYCCRAH